MAAVYGASLLFQLSATPIAVLRLFDRFGVFAWLEVVTAVARGGSVRGRVPAGAGLWTFLLLVMALSVAYSGAGPDRMARVAPSGPRRVPQGARGRRRNALSQDLELHLVAPSIVPGPPQHRRSGHAAHRDVARSGAVGLYHVAKRLGDATLKVGIPIQQVLFPDVARLWARREIQRLRRTVVQIDLISGGLAAGVLAGVALNVDLVLGLTVGAEYADAGILVILQLIATTTALFGTALRPACSAWVCRCSCSRS